MAGSVLVAAVSTEDIVYNAGIREESNYSQALVSTKTDKAWTIHQTDSTHCWCTPSTMSTATWKDPHIHKESVRQTDRQTEEICKIVCIAVFLRQLFGFFMYYCKYTLMYKPIPTVTVAAKGKKSGFNKKFFNPHNDKMRVHPNWGHLVPKKR